MKRTNQVSYGGIENAVHKASLTDSSWLLSGSITFAVKSHEITKDLTFNFVDAATEKQAIEDCVKQLKRFAEVIATETPKRES